MRHIREAVGEELSDHDGLVYDHILVGDEDLDGLGKSEIPSEIRWAIQNLVNEAADCGEDLPTEPRTLYGLDVLDGELDIIPSAVGRALDIFHSNFQPEDYKEGES